jgi:hypothetical protein
LNIYVYYTLEDDGIDMYEINFIQVGYYATHEDVMTCASYEDKMRFGRIGFKDTKKASKYNELVLAYSYS